MGQTSQLTPYRRSQEQVRLRAAAMFQAGLVQADVARAVGVSHSAVSKWHKAWQEGGAQALAGRRNPGRRPELSPAQLRALDQALRQGPQAHGYKTQLWTLARIAKLIQKLFGVQYHAGHVWRLLGRMGWSCQKPARRAKQRDEQAVQGWQTQQWPAIKKGQWRAAR